MRPRRTPAGESPARTETAYFAGGCFWGIEDDFRHGPGVIDVVSGYMQGRTDRPTYGDVCGGDTGHCVDVAVGSAAPASEGQVLGLKRAQLVEHLAARLLVGG